MGPINRFDGAIHRVNVKFVLVSRLRICLLHIYPGVKGFQPRTRLLYSHEGRFWTPPEYNEAANDSIRDLDEPTGGIRSRPSCMRCNT